jgi:hypothetical protein
MPADLFIALRNGCQQQVKAVGEVEFGLRFRFRLREADLYITS